MKYQILDINEQEIASKYHLSPLVAKVITKANLNDSQIQELLTHCDTLTKSNRSGGYFRKKRRKTYEHRFAAKFRFNRRFTYGKTVLFA